MSDAAAGTSPQRGSGEARPRLLVLRALGLGGFLTAVPAFRALDRARPGDPIDLAAPRAHADLLALAGLEWTLLPTEGPRTPPWRHPVPPGAAVNLHGSGPESVQALRALGPGRLWTHASPAAGTLGPEWPRQMHDVDLWCRLLAYYGISADPTDLRLPLPRPPKEHAGAAVVHPGAAFAARRWPPERFAALARRLADSGLDVVITGSAAERRLALEVAHRAGLDEQRVPAGRTTLPELGALVAHAALVVCGDTGAAHLATAYGTPSVVLFGPVDPALWGPRIDADRHACLWYGEPGDPNGGAPAPGLLRIGVAEAAAAAERVLGRTRPAARSPSPPAPRAPHRLRAAPASASPPR
ncbi:glycosyltransferase family 9 protein [Streptomonospora wellingtoniae]|uniref:Glycosyltransferase family 9 protein n=1 Tax=Streptomonospora wellingtoniae TaxID=3075544 RepID=A0ABU2KTB6_9ACTN|nr:glycosyltransferase family 9 protein [Streptomonospora sp. DSM 45055]MDT0302541.1 glycosyltransferase family 9 protein [Streptomonospora sp. DSM 45055]